MQFFKSSVPVTLSVVVLLFNFSIFTSASPLSSLIPRDLVCAADYQSCTNEAGALYCCPPNTQCAPNAGCAATTLTSVPTTTPTSSTLSQTTSPNASSTPSAAPAKKNNVFFNKTMIIAIAAGGGAALLLIIIGSWACHRKRQQGRALLAAYESPDRTPYEAISLKTKKSTSSFQSAAPPATPITGNPQQTATPPPVYMNGDEKEMFPRYPPQAKEMSGSRSVSASPLATPNRAVFPVEVLSSQRSSSLPPYSPERTAFPAQQMPFSPQQKQTLSPTAFSPVQTSFAPQQVPFSPQQAAFAPQTGFTFVQHSGSTPVHSPPHSPTSPTMAAQKLFLPVDQHQHQHQQQYHQQQQQQQQQQDHGYPMAY